MRLLSTCVVIAANAADPSRSPEDILAADAGLTVEEMRDVILAHTGLTLVEYMQHLNATVPPRTTLSPEQEEARKWALLF